MTMTGYMCCCTLYVRTVRKVCLSLRLVGRWLAFLFKMAGVEDVTKAFMVRKALRGYRKGHGRPESQRPMSLGMLGVLPEVLPRVCFTSFEVQLFRTAFFWPFLELYGWVNWLVLPRRWLRVCMWWTSWERGLGWYLAEWQAYRYARLSW